MYNDRYMTVNEQLMNQRKKKTRVVSKKKVFIAGSLLVIALTGGKMAIALIDRAIEVEHSKYTSNIPTLSLSNDEREAAKTQYNYELYNADTLLELNNEIDSSYERLIEMIANNKKVANTQEINKGRISVQAQYETFNENYGNIDYRQLSNEDRLNMAALLYPLSGTVIDAQIREKEIYLSEVDPKSDEHKKTADEVAMLRGKLMQNSDDAKTIITIQIEGQLKQEGKGKWVGYGTNK